MKSSCPLCGTNDYSALTLKQHFLLCHRERPVLVGLILDLLDHITHLKDPIGEKPAHDNSTCILCKKMAQVGHRKLEFES